MRRGEIWTVSGGSAYSGKPRPAVIIQDDIFSESKSVTVCILTTSEAEASLIRLDISPNTRNGLRAISRLMVDKISTVPKSRVGERIGYLDNPDIVRLNQALLVFLGLTVSPTITTSA